MVVASSSGLERKGESKKGKEENRGKGTSGKKSVKDPSQEPGSFVSVYWKRGRKRGEEKAL